jgi:hypothetical protein
MRLALGIAGNSSNTTYRLVHGEGLSVNAGVQVGFLCGDGKVKREETDLQKDKNGSITYKDMQKTEAPWPAKKVDVAIPLGLSYEYMNVILDARYNVSRDT